MTRKKPQGEPPPIVWPRGPTSWFADHCLYVSVPFTWNLPALRQRLMQRSFEYNSAIVGGPAIDLIPSAFHDLPHVATGHVMPGILQRINPLATRTTTGCIRKCSFCGIGIGKIEAGGFRELDDWPDLPVICDNNLLAASMPHFEKVIDRLVRHGWADFNQGLDARLLTREHAILLAQIRRPMIRLALDRQEDAGEWNCAFHTLTAAGIAKANIRSYCLIGFNDTPDNAWHRCNWIEEHGIKALPMWFHALDQLKANIVSPEQATLGWTNEERKRIMRWFYKHTTITRMIR